MASARAAARALSMAALAVVSVAVLALSSALAPRAAQPRPATCVPDGLLDYLGFTFCQLGGAPWLAESLLVLWLLVLFYATAEIAESHFCPMLSSLSSSLRIGADVFSGFASIVDGDFGITMGQLLGAGCLITSVIVGSIAFVQPPQLKPFSFLRDTLFYAVALVLVMALCLDGYVNLWEALAFLVYYGVFIGVATGVHYWGLYRAKPATPGLSVNTPGDAVVVVTPPTPGEPEQSDEFRPLTSLSIADYSPTESTRLLRTSDSERRYRSPQEVPTGAASAFSSLPTKRSSPDAGVTAPAAEGVWLPFSHREHRKGTEGKSLLARLAAGYADYVEWDEKEALGKALHVATLPVSLAFNATLPHAEPGRYRPWLFVVASTLSPVPTLVASRTIASWFVHVPAVVWTCGACLAVSLAIALAYRKREEPPRACVLLYSFAGSMVWMYVIADEIVSLLTVFGAIFRVSPSLLGLTVLSFGNCVTDFVANITVARQGHPDMAVAAAYAGPLFNMLIGLGVGLTVACARSYPAPYRIVMTDSSLIGFVFLLGTLAATVVVVPLRRYVVEKWLGVSLMLVYAGFLALSILADLGFIHIEHFFTR
eukprot:m51a1_g5399 putative cation calcium exchanger 5-like (597) ;mRNA; f:48179-50735